MSLEQNRPLPSAEKTKSNQIPVLYKSFQLKSLPSEVVHFILMLHVPVLTLAISFLEFFTSDTLRSVSYILILLGILSACALKLYSLFSKHGDLAIEFWSDHFCIKSNKTHNAYCLKIDDIISLKLQERHDRFPIQCPAIEVQFASNGKKEAVLLRGFRTQKELFSVFQFLERQILSKQSKAKNSWI